MAFNIEEPESKALNSVENRTPSLLRSYLDLWEAYHASGVNEVRDPADKENTSGDDWRHQHYMSVGRDALRIIVQTLIAAERRPPDRILDFPSGSGRVTRHLRAMFPQAQIGACDLYPEHFQFCAKHFAAEPILSKENLDELDIGTWDLIFCGSLLTHLPKAQFFAALRFMIRSLSPDGVAIVTLEGRHALHIQSKKWKLIGDDLFAIAKSDYDEAGFGFVDYEHDFRSKAFSRQAQYGVAIAKASWVLSHLENEYSVRVLGYSEREWDDHQDVLAFAKPGVDAPVLKPGPTLAPSADADSVEKLVAKVRAAKLTYLDPSALTDLAEAVRLVEKHNVPGDILELGCALGGSSIVLAHARGDATRPVRLYDVFGLIPPPSERDGPDVQQRYADIVQGRSRGIDGDTYYGYQDDLKTVVSNNLRRFGVERDSVELVKGLFDETLWPRGPIALAHIDCDWYASVTTCLWRIDRWLSAGGIMVIDDYDAWSGCRLAVDRFLSERGDSYEKQVHSRLWLGKK